MITAMRALDQGRDVFVIPANLGVASFAGNLKLMQDGAYIAADAWDILQQYVAHYPTRLRRMGRGPVLQPEPAAETENLPAAEPTPAVSQPAVSQSVREKIAQLQGDEKLLADLLLEGPRYADDLMEATGLPSGCVLASLTLLEVKGIIHRPGPKRYALTGGEV